MSYRLLQVLPKDIHRTQMWISVPGIRDDPPLDFQDVELLRVRLVYDSAQNAAGRAQRPRQTSLNWNAIFWLALAIGAGAGFWTAVGLLIAHAW